MQSVRSAKQIRLRRSPGTRKSEAAADARRARRVLPNVRRSMKRGPEGKCRLQPDWPAGPETLPPCAARVKGEGDGPARGIPLDRRRTRMTFVEALVHNLRS